MVKQYELCYVEGNENLNTGRIKKATNRKMKQDYTVIRSSRRTLAVQIKDGAVIVRAPYSVTNAQIKAFVNDKQI